MNLFNAQTPDDLETVRTLFREYQRGLGVDLCFQGFEEERAAPPKLDSKSAGISGALR